MYYLKNETVLWHSHEVVCTAKKSYGSGAKQGSECLPMSKQTPRFGVGVCCGVLEQKKIKTFGEQQPFVKGPGGFPPNHHDTGKNNKYILHQIASLLAKSVCTEAPHQASSRDHDPLPCHHSTIRHPCSSHCPITGARATPLHPQIEHIIHAMPPSATGATWCTVLGSLGMLDASVKIIGQCGVPPSLHLPWYIISQDVYYIALWSSESKSGAMP